MIAIFSCCVLFWQERWKKCPYEAPKRVFREHNAWLWRVQKISNCYQNPWCELTVFLRPSDHDYLPKQTGASYDTSIRFYESERKVLLIFQISCSRLWQSHSDCLESLKIKLLSEHDRWLWVAWKNFLVVTNTQHVCSQSSLGSYLSAKANGSTVRYFLRI